MKVETDAVLATALLPELEIDVNKVD